MTQDLRVALVTSLNDRLVGPLRRSLDEVEKNLKEIEKELTKVTQGSQQAGRALAGMEGPATAARAAADLGRNTENAVGLAKRLQQAWSAAGNVMNGVVKGMAAYQAARYVVAPVMQQARTYDRQLADASNTAFSGRDLAGRKAGMVELNAAVESSLRAGGGTRDQALQGLQKQLANGVAFDQAKATMPGITMAATASGASTVDIAEIVTKLLKDGFDPKVIEEAIGKAIAAGQAGSFEMKDMAQWIPKLIAAGKVSGQRGLGDYERMLAMAQVSTTTAGGSPEAGNNLLNFLLKLNSFDTANDAKKMGIDLSGSLVAARAKGVSAPEAFLNLVRQTADSDPRMVKLRQQFGAAGTDTERMESLKAQESILQGSAIGKLVQDRQALMPLIALLNNQQEYSRVLGLVQSGGSQTTKDNFSLISSTADFRVQQAENEKLFAVSSAMSGPNEALAKLADATSSVYQQFPGFASAIEASKLALYGLAAAAGAAGLAGLLTGKGGALVAGGAGALAKRVAGMGAGVATAVGGLSAVGVAAAGGAGYGLGTLAYRGMDETGAMDALGGGIARLLALLGSDDAKADVARRERYEQTMLQMANRPIVLTIDGREIATAVNGQNAYSARRN